MGTSPRVPSIAALLGIVLVWSIASTALAVARDKSWINRGGYRNSAGEWLCGVTRGRNPWSDRGYGQGQGSCGLLARSVGAARPLRLTKPTAIFPDGLASSYRPPTRSRALISGIASNEVRSGPEQDVIRAFLFGAHARESRRLQQT